MICVNILFHKKRESLSSPKSCERLTCCIFSSYSTNVKKDLLGKSLGNDPFGVDRHIHDSLSFSGLCKMRRNPSSLDQTKSVA